MITLIFAKKATYGLQTTDIISCHVLLGRYDYLTISSNREFHKYCGDKTGQWVVIAGDAAVITFHSDSTVQKSGFVVPFLQKALPVCECYQKTHITH